MRRFALLFVVIPLLFVGGVGAQCICFENPFTGQVTCSAPEGGGPGGGGVPNATPTPAPTPAPTTIPTIPMSQADIWYFEGGGGEYSYNDDCTVAIDPITVVVRRNGAATVQHVSHHGVDGAPSPTPEPLNEDATSQFWGLGEGKQHYWDLVTCVWGEVSQATNDGRREDCPNLFTYCAESRWHARCNVVESLADPGGGTFSVCTPHWDQDGGGYFDLFGEHGCWHYVPEVFGDTWDGPGGFPNVIDASGFTAGREYLYQLLVVEGGHRSLGSYEYGNIQEMTQCNGDLTASNGFVRFIEVMP